MLSVARAVALFSLSCCTFSISTSVSGRCPSVPSAATTEQYVEPEIEPEIFPSTCLLQAHTTLEKAVLRENMTEYPTFASQACISMVNYDYHYVCSASHSALPSSSLYQTSDKKDPVDTDSDAFRAAAPSALSQMMRQVAIPILALLVGTILFASSESGNVKVASKLLLYFGMQSAMNIYMKAVLSDTAVATGKTGFPAAFAVTAIQQSVGLTILVTVMYLSRFTAFKYTPQPLQGSFEYLSVVLLSLSFVLNIALNNYSLVFLDISVNMAIRSMNPVTTYATQLILAKLFGDKLEYISAFQTSCLAVGVFCAYCVVMSKQSASAEASSDLTLGVVTCLLSLLAASVNMCLVAMLGLKVKLNPIDTIYYMAAPAALFLLGPIFFMPHAINWSDTGQVTDWWIVLQVIRLQPMVMILAMLSGVFALGYNMFLYNIVQTMSATVAAFAGNFNKAATIALSILVGLEAVPEDARHQALLIVGICGNAAAFCAYTLANTREMGGGKH